VFDDVDVDVDVDVVDVVPDSLLLICGVVLCECEMFVQTCWCVD